MSYFHFIWPTFSRGSFLWFLGFHQIDRLRTVFRYACRYCDEFWYLYSCTDQQRIKFQYNNFSFPFTSQWPACIYIDCWYSCLKLTNQCLFFILMQMTTVMRRPSATSNDIRIGNHRSSSYTTPGDSPPSSPVQTGSRSTRACCFCWCCCCTCSWWMHDVTTFAFHVNLYLFWMI